MSGDERLDRLPEALVDKATFTQILEMDDDDGEFSKSIVYDFFDQAEQTFSNMDTALESKDLKTLGELGHFLKGSSATLGLIKVRDNCEKIQHYGAMKNATGTEAVSDKDKLLDLLQSTIKDVKVDYRTVEKELRKFYGEKID